MNQRRDERGAVAVWMSVTILAIIVILGIGVDFSGHARATAHAQGVAAEAARAGGQYLVISDGRASPDFGDSVRAAQSYIDSSPFAGSTTIRGGQLVVEVSGAYESQFLSVIGINQLRVEASAAAEVKSTFDGSER